MFVDIFRKREKTKKVPQENSQFLEVIKIKVRFDILSIYIQKFIKLSVKETYSAKKESVK